MRAGPSLSLPRLEARAPSTDAPILQTRPTAVRCAVVRPWLSAWLSGGALDLPRFRGHLPSRQRPREGVHMGRKHRHYSEGFRAEAVRLAETSGHSIRQVALDLGIANQTLGVWIRQAHERPPGTPLGSDERAELTEL